jgi:hypothetical protein
MKQKLDSAKFTAAIKKETPAEVEAALKAWIDQNPVMSGVNVYQIIAIAKMICSVSNTVCPIIGNL